MSPDPMPLRDVISDLAGGSLGARPLETARLWAEWRNIVGEAIARHVEPSSLRGGVLRLRADSPVWANELTYLSQSIRAAANALLGSEVIAEVRVWTSPGPVRTEDASSTRSLGPEPPGAHSDNDPADALKRAHRAWARRRPETGKSGY